MVADHISQLQSYVSLGRHFKTAADYVNGLEVSRLQPGRNEVDGDNVFAILVDRELTETPAVWEMHERYADIHLILEGGEAVGFYPLGRLPEKPVYDRESDSASAEGLQGFYVDLRADEFVIAMPQDVHLPNCPGSAGPRSRKLILKVLVDEA